jgi:hypothetical protein
MNQKPIDDHKLDDQLADFTDQLLNGETPVDLSEGGSDNQILSELLQTVAYLAAAFGEQEVDQEVASRIEKNLLLEWHQTGEKEDHSGFWPWLRGLIDQEKSLYRTNRNRKAAYSLAFVSLTVIIMVVAVSILMPGSPGTDHLVGTASGYGLPLGTLIIFAAVVGLGYLFIRKRK